MKNMIQKDFELQYTTADVPLMAEMGIETRGTSFLNLVY